MNTFQCAISLKHWTKHMATMESAAHEVTFNMISYGRLKGDLPSTGMLSLLCAGRRSTLWKTLRPRDPRTNGCCVLRDVPKSIESRKDKKKRALRPSEHTESGFCSRSKGIGGSHPQGVLPDSWVTPRALLFCLDFSTLLACIHRHGLPLWRGRKRLIHHWHEGS